MANILYDFNGISPYVIPYVGGGVGYAWRSASNLHTPHDTTSDTGGNFAYQGIVGAAFPIASVPGLSVTAEYRYFSVLNSTLSYLGGEGGVSGNRVIGQAFLGITYGPPVQVYYLIAAYTFISVVAMFAFTRTPLGRRYFVITEAGRITGVRATLPTQRARDTFEVINTTSNKFSIAAFWL